MKIIAIGSALGLAAVVLPVAASAQSWQPIAQRSTRLETRIDQGIRSGALTRPEARQVRSDLRTLTALEYRYRRSGGGLSAGERRELDRRYDALSTRVRFEKHDRQDRRR
jgi:hypothetical protein